MQHSGSGSVNDNIVKQCMQIYIYVLTYGILIVIRIIIFYFQLPGDNCRSQVTNGKNQRTLLIIKSSEKQATNENWRGICVYECARSTRDKRYALSVTEVCKQSNTTQH